MYLSRIPLLLPFVLGIALGVKAPAGLSGQRLLDFINSLPTWDYLSSGYNNQAVGGFIVRRGDAWSGTADEVGGVPTAGTIADNPTANMYTILWPGTPTTDTLDSSTYEFVLSQDVRAVGDICWYFDDTHGTGLQASNGGTNFDDSQYSNAALVPGVGGNGRALAVDATNNGADFGDIDMNCMGRELLCTTGWSLSFWVRIHRNDVTQHLLSFQSGDNGFSFNIDLTPPDVFDITFTVADGGSSFRLQHTFATFTTNTWYFISIVWKPKEAIISNRQFTLYIDCELAGTSTVAGGAEPLVAPVTLDNNHLQIGENDVDQNFDMDDLCFTDALKTQSELCADRQEYVSDLTCGYGVLYAGEKGNVGTADPSAIYYISCQANCDYDATCVGFSWSETARSCSYHASESQLMDHSTAVGFNVYNKVCECGTTDV